MARQLTTRHLKMYQENGKLHRLFQVIREDPELSFEIRRGNEVMVYFNKKKTLTISESGKEPTFKPLSAGYYKNEPERPAWVDTFEQKDWNKKNNIQHYFRKAKEYAYKESRKAEFQLQQSIALGNCSFNDKCRYVAVDMEWAFSQKGLKRPISRTRIDLVIIDTQKNSRGKNDIFLAEVKLGIGATDGKSGMQDHVDKTSEIYNCSEACEALIADMHFIIRQKSELGILKGPVPDFVFEDKPRMMFILGYRGENELKKLKAMEENLKYREMEKPVCIYIDTRYVL